MQNQGLPSDSVARTLADRSWLDRPEFERLAQLRVRGITPYPLETGRSLTLEALEQGIEPGDAPEWVAGRLVRLELASDSPRLLLQDSTGSRWLPLSPPLVGPESADAFSWQESSRRVLGALRGGDVISCQLRWQQACWQVEAVTMLAPALQPLPAHRTPGEGASLDTLVQRAGVLRGIRRFFDLFQFVEIETPIMALHPGLEPHLDPFESRFRPTAEHAGRPVWLLTSPEYALKRTLVQGLERVYQLSRVFRNGEVGAFHNPEFTLLEWYRAYADYRAIMTDVEALIGFLAELQGSGKRLTWQGYQVDLTAPWPQMTVCEAFLTYAGIDLTRAHDIASLRAQAERENIKLPEGIDWEEAYFRILVERVEPCLGFGRPVFLTDYPAPFAALARVRPEAFPVAERFELYIAGVEVCNAYSELNDPQLQAQRFKEEQEQRARLGLPVFEPDPDYLNALCQGLPPTGGIAVGVDRLVMLLLDLPDVRRALGFPFPMGP